MNRQTGTLLIEMVVAFTVLSLGLLGFFASFSSNFSASNDVHDQDQARVALVNVAETLRGANFSTLYQTYNGATFEVPTLKQTGSGGYTFNASVQCNFYVNETSLPAEFGPIADLDGLPGLTTVNCSTTYKILPAKLSLTYTTGGRTTTKEQYLVLAH